MNQFSDVKYQTAVRYWSWFRIYVYGGRNSKYPHRYDADHRRKQKHRVSILFISKKFSSWNLDLHEKELSVFFEHQKECFLNWILAKSVGDKSLCTAANFPTKSSSIQIKLTYYNWSQLTRTKDPVGQGATQKVWSYYDQ